MWLSVDATYLGGRYLDSSISNFRPRRKEIYLRQLLKYGKSSEPKVTKEDHRINVLFQVTVLGIIACACVKGADGAHYGQLTYTIWPPVSQL